ncbi:MAG: glycosyltransferase [bacterium]
MRIAIFTNTYLPTQNGVAISTANLREGLIKLGHEPFVFAPLVVGTDSKDEKNIFRYPAFNVRSIANYPIALPISPEISKVLKEAKFDLVHTEHPWWVGEWGLDYARKSNLPIITTVHTRYDIYAKLIPLPQELLISTLKNKLEEYLGSVDLITTPGGGSKERLLKEGVKTPIEVVSNPTDLSDFWSAKADKIRKKFGLKSGDILIGYVGRLSEEKNIQTLLATVEIILKNKPNVKMVLIGDGPDREELEKRASEISKDRIIFTGNVPHKEIPFYDAALDTFVSASKSEIQPMTFAEAMATGTPIVVFDVAGCNDMVQDKENGRLVATKEGSKGLAQAVIDLISDKDELSDMGKRAKKWATRYEQENATRDMLKAYKLAISLHKKTSRASEGHQQLKIKNCKLKIRR